MNLRLWTAEEIVIAAAKVKDGWMLRMSEVARGKVKAM